MDGRQTIDYLLKFRFFSQISKKFSENFRKFLKNFQKIFENARAFLLEISDFALVFLSKFQKICEVGQVGAGRRRPAPALTREL